ncbi:MAG: threonine/serine dehydratase [Blastocatellia bacterium]
MKKQVKSINFKTIEKTAKNIKNQVLKTPCTKNYWLTDVVNLATDKNFPNIYIKWENQQLTGSFKLRGAFNKLLRLKKLGIKEVLGVSAGNHGLGMAYAASKLGMQSTIVVPKTAVATKIAGIKRFRANLVIEGEDYDKAEIIARQMAKERKIEFVSPYNDLEIIAGQATIAVEMLKNHSFDLLLVPVGGGGLLAGCAIVGAKYKIDVIGVQPANSTAMQSSFQAGEIVKVTELPTIADGLSGNLEDNTCTFPIIKKYVKDIVTVTEEEIEQTIFNFLLNDHQIIEGSGAVAAAALLTNKVDFAKYKNIGVIVSGGNIDLGKTKGIIDKYLTKQPIT